MAGLLFRYAAMWVVFSLIIGGIVIVPRWIDGEPVSTLTYLVAAYVGLLPASVLLPVVEALRL